MKRMVSIIAVTMLTIALTACGGSSQAALRRQNRPKRSRKQHRRQQLSLQVKHLPRLIRMSWSHISLLPALLKALQSVSLL